MADVLPAISEKDIFDVLRLFLSRYVSCPVVRGQVNRVPQVKGAVVVMTATGMVALSVPVETHTDTEKTIERGVKFSVQIDVYGTGAQGRAAALSMLCRSSEGFDFYASSGFNMQLLYADDAQQMPIINGEEQFQERWTFPLLLQVNESVTITTETANALTIGLVNVDASYPA